MRVAFVGLGVMGYPMAGYLVKAGHDVTVYNRTVEKAEKWCMAYGGALASTPGKAAADAEVAALKAKLGDAEADGRALVEQAKAQAEQLKVDAAAKAQADAESIRQKASADVEGMRAQTAADIQAEVSAKALAVAEEVAVANLDDATQTALIESYIDNVGGN